MARRPFNTLLDLDSEPEWAPLQQIARLSRESHELPSFHEGEFMYMARLTNARKRLTIHLYKQYDTRRYLNLDDAGHAYEYRGSPDTYDQSSGGKYRVHRSLAEAVERLEVWRFHTDVRWLRSFPPDAWPPDRPRGRTLLDPSPPPGS